MEQCERQRKAKAHITNSSGKNTVKGFIKQSEGSTRSYLYSSVLSEKRNSKL